MLDKQQAIAIRGPAVDELTFDLLAEKLTDKGEDAFEYQKIANSLAEILIKTSPPFVFAVCGGWGAGKSSLLRYLLDYLPKSREGGLIFYFNAWRASIHDDVLATFVVELCEQLKESQIAKTRGSRTEEFVDCLKILADSAAEAFADWNIATKVASRVYRNAREQHVVGLKSVIAAEAKVRKNFEKIASRIDEYRVNNLKVTPFVIIDELDRCAPPVVVKVVEALRMIFSSQDELSVAVRKHSGIEAIAYRNPFKYILAIDERYVARAFSEQYHLSLDEAYAYISKFIQYSYHFPLKDWTRFFEQSISRFPDHEKWFPTGSSADLSDLASALGCEHPRDARRILTFPIVWQKMYYDEAGVYGGLIKDVLRECNIDAGQDGTYSAALRALNGYLFTYAGVKGLFPSQVSWILQLDVVPRLPDYPRDALEAFFGGLEAGGSTPRKYGSKEADTEVADGVADPSGQETDRRRCLQTLRSCAIKLAELYDTSEEEKKIRSFLKRSLQRMFRT